MSYYNTITVKTEWDGRDIFNNCGGIAYDLTDEQMDEVIDKLGDWFKDTPTEDDIDEFFRFEEDTIADWLGFEDAEHLRFANEHEDEDIYRDCGGGYVTKEEVEDEYKDYLAECEESGTESEYEDFDEWADANSYELVTER